MYVLRQIHFKPHDDFNPKRLQSIAQHFKIGNARACMFALFYVYDIQSQKLPKISRECPTESHKLFMHFRPDQLKKAEAVAEAYGISFGELCKRAILEVSDLISGQKLQPYHPKVLKYFEEHELPEAT